MEKAAKLKIILSLLIFMFCQILHGEVATEVLTTRVLDEAGLLSSAQIKKLDHSLEQLKNNKNIDLVFLTLSSLNDQSIEVIANERFERYAIGSKGKDNGLLFVMSVQDRKMRLEVGRGLEGSLPDVTVKRLLDDEIRPYFKDGKYNEAFEYLANRFAVSDLEIQGLVVQSKTPYFLRFLPLIFAIFFGIFIYFIGYKNEILSEKQNLNKVFGQAWPEQALKAVRRTPLLNTFRKILLLLFFLPAFGISFLSIFHENDMFKIIGTVGNFVLGFLILIPMNLVQFRCPWIKWYAEYNDKNVKAKIKNILNEYGYKYSSKTDSFTSISSSRSRSSSSSSSSPSGGGSSSGGGASSSW